MKTLKFRAYDGKSYTYFDIYNVPSPEVLDGCAIEQFTGLLDKQGKEIYEGDILKFAVYNAIGKVIWDDRYFSWWIKLLHRPSDNAQDISLFDAYTSVGWEDSIEIIGNIYENSELLAQPGSSAKDGHGASREHNAPEGGLK